MRRQSGFGLVEIMVALVIGLFMAGVTIAMLMSNKVTWHVSEDIGRLQENARVALNYLAYDLRMAGYFGCAHNSAAITAHVNGSSGGTLLDYTRPIEGYDSSAPVLLQHWLPSANADVAGIRPGTDAITVRYAGAVAGAPELTADMTDVASDPQITSPNDLRPGDVVVISDCASADIFQVSGPAAGGSGLAVLEHAAVGSIVQGNNTANAGPGCPGAGTGCLSRAYSAGAEISRYAAYRYYIADGDRDGDGAVEADYPVLYRKGLNNAGGTVTESATQLVDGVEHMSITYGIDTDGDRLPDVYVPAHGSSGTVDLTTAAGWDNVIAVKIGLLLRSPDEIATERDDRDYTVNGDLVCATGSAAVGCALFHPADRRRRRVFETVVLLRNRLTIQ